MNPEKFAFAVAVVIFAGGALGLVVRRVLPEQHVTGGPKDLIGAVAGLRGSRSKSGRRARRRASGARFRF